MFPSESVGGNKFRGYSHLVMHQLNATQSYAETLSPRRQLTEDEIRGTFFSNFEYHVGVLIRRRFGPEGIGRIDEVIKYITRQVNGTYVEVEPIVVGDDSDIFQDSPGLSNVVHLFPENTDVEHLSETG